MGLFKFFKLQCASREVPQPTQTKDQKPHEVDTLRVDLHGRVISGKKIPTSSWELEEKSETKPDRRVDVPVSVAELPNIGPGGRFLTYKLEKGILHDKIDFLEAYDPALFTTLKEINPFSVRAWMGEYHYDGGIEVKNRIELITKLPSEVMVHGVVYKHDRIVGEGAVGMVARYVSEDGREIAAKVIPLDRRGRNCYDDDDNGVAIRELRALDEVAYQAVLNPGDESSPIAKAIRRVDGQKMPYGDKMAKFIDATYLCPDEGSKAVAIFFEFLSGGDLKNVTNVHESMLEDKNNDSTADVITDSVEYGIGMAKALIDVHSCGITHRDVKPGNFMSDGNRNIKLTDFGISHGDFVRASRGLSEKMDEIDKMLKNDLEGLYALVAMAGEGFAVKNKKKKYDLLSYEEQKEIWDWLQRWQEYEYNPEISHEQRIECLKNIIYGWSIRRPDGSTKEMAGLHGPNGLIERYESKIKQLARMEKALEQWNKSEWTEDNRNQIDKILGNNVDETASVDERELIKEIQMRGLVSVGRLTETGRIAGTVRYMAPEVALGKTGRDRGTHEDVFSFGVVMAELTGLFGLIAGGKGISIQEALHSRALDANVGLVLEYDHVALPRGYVRKLEDEVRRPLPNDLKEDVKFHRTRERLIEMLKKESGVLKLLGLIAECVQKNYSKRPTMTTVLDTLEKIQYELTLEVAQKESKVA
jgi:serine/threonine protein kinase